VQIMEQIRNEIHKETRRGPDGVEAIVAVNVAESPLTWLFHRRDQNGNRLIDETELAAGERLRRDFEASAHSPRLTMRWDREPGAQGRHFGLLAAPEAALAARDRVHAALTGVGDDLASILLKVCCLDSGLEAAERALGWPKRSGKLVLKIALGRLAAHYGLSRR
jgi:Domain of unknown function (DUF6456)